MRRVRVGALVWLALVLASQPFVATTEEGQPERVIRVPAMGDGGPLPGRTMRVAVREFRAPRAPDAPGAAGLPVLLIHGSPGSASNFEALGNALATHGRDAWALDLPGFGQSDALVPSYSILAHARALLATLDALGLERVHLVAWSMGGGVALHAAELAPERVASLTLIASIGVQAAEGSGSYAFEHVKYAFNFLLVVVLPELVPHFGLLGPRQPRHAYARNFWDSDQRPLRAILQRLATPTLILHGARDFLVPAWTAEASHALLARSRLVMLDASHFLPFPEPMGQLAETQAELLPFLAACDGEEPAGIAFEHVDRTTPPATGLAPFGLQRRVPWWALFAAIVGAWCALPEATVLACAVLFGTLQLDLGFALLACALALGFHDLTRRRARTALAGLRNTLAGLGWTLVLMFGGAYLGSELVLRLAPSVGGVPALVLAVALLYTPLRLAQRFVPGRTLLVGRGKRLALTTSSRPRSRRAPAR